MPKKKQTYRVSGSSAVVVDGVRHLPDAVFEAVPGEVGFLVEIGALAKSEPDDKKKD